MVAAASAIAVVTAAAAAAVAAVAAARQSFPGDMDTSSQRTKQRAEEIEPSHCMTKRQRAEATSIKRRAQDSAQNEPAALAKRRRLT